jgi:hypothetical protein
LFNRRRALTRARFQGPPTGPEFRVFPYENPALEPFETAVAALNPQVAVKVRSAAVHAALSDVWVFKSMWRR